MHLMENYHVTFSSPNNSINYHMAHRVVMPRGQGVGEVKAGMGGKW